MISQPLGEQEVTVFFPQHLQLAENKVYGEGVSEARRQGGKEGPLTGITIRAQKPEP